MTNISKNKLSKKVEEKLFTQFTNLFSVANKSGLSDMFEALFTDAEKIMFIKRVGIVMLLSKHCSNYRISKTLKVSDTTVRNIKIAFQNGKYDALLGTFNNKKFDSIQFLKVLEKLLQAGMPPQGRGRWKWLYEMK